MAISLSPETQKLIEERLADTGFTTPDELIYFALKVMPESCEVDLSELDDETRAAIERAEAEPGDGTPVDEVFAALRKKYSL